MVTKQSTNSLFAPDGSYYVTLSDGAGNLTGSGTADLPAGATFVSNSVQGTTATATATLPAAVGKTTYLKGFSVRNNATAAVQGFILVGNILGGTLSFNHFTPANTTGMGVSEENFTIGIPANATNTTVTVAAPAAGTGGIVSVAAWGYQL